MLVEFIAHTRMVKFRTVGWAHWLVMIGFLGGAMLWFEAYGQTFDPSFHWPIFGSLAGLPPVGRDCSASAPSSASSR